MFSGNSCLGSISNKKFLLRLANFDCKGVEVAGGGGGGFESIKKGKIVTKILFQIMLNEVLKICKKLYLLM